jgi:alkylation response protein AidB-like acyl-CoA dehydrogenase
MVESKTLLDRVIELTPLIISHRADAESAARMAPEVHAALGQAGVYRATAPREVGGAELRLAEQVALTEQLGYADVSVAWCIANSWISGFVASRMTADARAVIFERPNAFYGFGLAPSGRARPTATGFEVTGRWPVVSGCEVASWFVLASIIQNGADAASGDGPPDVRFLVIDRPAVEVLDTWSGMNGMRGTGSHAVRVTDADVPSALAVRL